MKKQLLSLLLTFVMVVVMLPLMTNTAEAVDVYEVHNSSDLFDAFNGHTHFRLAADVTDYVYYDDEAYLYSKYDVESGYSREIDLNNHTLTLYNKCETGTGTFRAIWVYNGGKLTIKNGTLRVYTNSPQTNAVNAIESAGTVILENCTIIAEGSSSSLGIKSYSTTQLYVNGSLTITSSGKALNGTIATSPVIITAGANEGAATVVSTPGAYPYAKIAQAYTITATASSGGTVSGGGNVAAGSSVKLTAIPAAGYKFVNWTENSSVVSTDASYTFTATGPRTLVANFELDTRSVSVIASAGGTVSGGGTYNYGATATLTATANPGYKFVNWTKNSEQVSTDATYSFTVTEAATYTANFASNTYTVTLDANGGSVTPSSTNVTFGGTYGTLPTPTRPHHTFNGWFTAASGGNQVTSTTQVTATSDHRIYAQWTPISHPICGASCTGTHGGETHGNVTWTAWSGGEIPYNNNEAYIFLSANTNSSIVVNGGKTLYLCLNGKTLDGGSDAAIKIGQNGTVIVCDCSGGNGSITATGEYGRGIYSTDASAKTTLYGVTISGCSYAGIECKSGEVNLYDSNIADCTTTRGGIRMNDSDNSVVRLFNSDITKCSTTKSDSAGAAYVYKGTLELHGECNITNCSGPSSAPQKVIYLNGTLKLIGDYTQMTLPAIEIGSKCTIDVTDLENLTSGPCIKVNPGQISTGTGIVLAQGTADPSRFTFTDSYNIYTYGKENQVFMVKPWPLAWSNASTVLADYPQDGAWYKGGANITVTPKDGVTLYEMLGGEAWGGSFNVGNTTQKVDVEKIIFAYDSASTKYYMLTLTYKVDAVAPTIKVDNLPNEGEYFSTYKVFLTIRDDVNPSSDLAITITCNDRNYELYSGYNRYFKADQNGIYVITATDKVGNVTTVHQKINFIDDADPVINNVTVSPSQPDGENDWYITQPTVTVSAEDSQSGVKEYSFDGGNTWQASASKTFSDGTHTVIIQVKDKANKVVTHSEQYTLKVDTVKPVVSTSVSTSEWTNEDVVVTVTVSESGSGIGKVEYSTDNGSTWTELAANANGSYTYSMTANGTISFCATDVAGNVSDTKSVTVGNIDKVAPTVTGVTVSPDLPASGWYTADVTITPALQDEGDSGVVSYEYTTDGGNNWTPVNLNTPRAASVPSFTISTNGDYTGKVKIRAIDEAGNSGAAYTVDAIKLDKATPGAPTVTAQVDGVNHASDTWTAGDVVFTLSGGSTTSGVAKYQYSIDGGNNWTDMTDNTVTHSSNTAASGVTYIFRAVNNAGAEGTHADPFIIKRSKLTAEELAETQYGAANLTIDSSPISEDWYVALPTITIEKETTVGEGGLAATTYYKLYESDAAEPAVDTELTGNTIAIPSDGVWTLMFWTEDVAGNQTAVYTDTVKADSVAPVIGEVTGNPGSWVADQAVIRFTASDVTSGIASITVARNDIGYPVNANSFTADQNGNYIIKVIDNAGHETTETVAVTKIDVTAPSAEFGTFANPDSTGWYKDDVTIPVTVSDAEQLSTWYYSLDNGTTWTEANSSSFTISDNGDYTNKVKIKAVDAVGKETVAGPITVKLDKATPEAPTVIAEVDNAVYTSGTWTTGNVVFTLSGGITTSGVDTYQYSTDGGATWNNIDGTTFTHTASTDDSGVTYIFRAVNNAGTEGTVSGSTKILKRQPYTILFSANAEDATGTMGDLTAYLDTNVQLTANAFEREGYSFMGWATTADGDVTYTDKQNVPEALTDQMNAEVVLYAVWSENPVISGTITGTNDTNVTVRLRDLNGNEYPAVVTPSGDDFIYTVTVPVGSYQLIVGATVTDASVTLTYAEDMSASKTHDIAIPTGNMNSSVVEIVDDAPKAIVDGLDAIASADPGSGVEIKLTVTAEEHNSSDAEQSAIRTEARGKTLEFVDLTLTKNGSDIGDTNTQLLTIVVPFEKGNKLNITVYRYHGTQAEKLNENPADGREGFVVGTDSITIYAMKFSTYAIGYTVPYYPTTYSVVVENAVNGTIKADPSYAASGSTVTVTVTPDKGYVLDKLTVTDIFGREVDVAEKDGKYTFKMPEAKVTVKATFKEEVAFQNPFKDVFATDYYYDAVLWAVKEGTTNGTSATTFSPNAPCTRAQMVTFLWRAAGSPEPTATTCPFTDVDMDSYYGKAVLWAVENGITKGTSDTTFSPDMECSRAQMATFLCRMAGGKAESDTIAFTDVKADAYYAESVQWAVENGITNGTGNNKFSPDATCTRAQMVTFLYRYYAK